MDRRRKWMTWERLKFWDEDCYERNSIWCNAEYWRFPEPLGAPLQRCNVISLSLCLKSEITKWGGEWGFTKYNWGTFVVRVRGRVYDCGEGERKGFTKWDWEGKDYGEGERVYEMGLRMFRRMWRLKEDQGESEGLDVEWKRYIFKSIEEGKMKTDPACWPKRWSLASSNLDRLLRRVSLRPSARSTSRQNGAAATDHAPMPKSATEPPNTKRKLKNSKEPCTNSLSAYSRSRSCKEVI